jgi:hypothetical protein
MLASYATPSHESCVLLGICRYFSNASRPTPPILELFSISPKLVWVNVTLGAVAAAWRSVVTIARGRRTVPPSRVHRRRETRRALRRSPPQRADERREHVGAESPVVAHRVARRHDNEQTHCEGAPWATLRRRGEPRRPTCAGRGTTDGASAIAGEGQWPQRRAREMSEAVLEDGAAQVRLELVDDELGQAAGLLGGQRSRKLDQRSATTGGAAPALADGDRSRPGVVPPRARICPVSTGCSSRGRSRARSGTTSLSMRCWC